MASLSKSKSSLSPEEKQKYWAQRSIDDASVENRNSQTAENGGRVTLEMLSNKQRSEYSKTDQSISPDEWFRKNNMQAQAKPEDQKKKKASAITARNTQITGNQGIIGSMLNLGGNKLLGN